jgi:hypothetical protein
MKFIGATVVYLAFGLSMGAGIYQAVFGHYWLLAVSFLVYLGLLIKLGCLPAGGSHH